MRKLTVFVVLVAVVLGGFTGYASAHRRHGYRPVISVDRGTLLAAASDEVTLERRDGEVVTKAVTRRTRLKGAGSIDELEPGRRVRVVSKADRATLIVQRAANRAEL